MSPVPTYSARTPLLFLGPNRMGRDLVVGDVHGCWLELEALLKHVGFHKAQDRLFLVGDVVDRGPYSKLMLDILRSPWCFAVRGNHEERLIKHLRAPHAVPAWDKDWLDQYTRGFTSRQTFAGTYLPVLEALPYVIVVGAGTQRFHVVHAELLEERQSVTNAMIETWGFRDPERALRRATEGRSLITAYETGRPVRRAHDPQMGWAYCGHSIVDMPIRLGRQVFIDGGAYLGYDNPASSEEEHMSAMHTPGLWMIDATTQECWKADSRTLRVHAHHVLDSDSV